MEIYINNVLVDGLVENPIVLQKALNNIHDAKSRQSVFSNDIEAYKTANNMAITGNAEIVESSTAFPYKKYDAKIIEKGIQIVKGFALLTETSETYKFNIYGGSADIYNLIKDKKLSELKLSLFNHDWDFGAILANRSNYNNWLDGYIYPDIDYGYWENIAKSARPSKEYFPAFHVKKLIEQMHTEAGYYPCGGFWNNNELFNQMILPFTGGSPKYSKTYRDNFNSKLSQLGSDISLSIATAGNLNQQTIIFNTDNSNGFTYNNTTGEVSFSQRIIQIGSKLNLTLDFQISTAASGSVDAFIDFVVYIFDSVGNVAASDGISFTKNISPSSPFTGSIQLNFQFLAKCFGSNFYVKIETANTDCRFNFANIKANSSVDFELGESAYPGSLWDIGSNLPEMTCGELLSTVINQFCLLIDADNDTKSVNLIELDSLLPNKPNAVDWSNKLVYDTEPIIKYAFDEWKQSNEFKYQTDENDKYLLPVPTYGNGFIEVENENIDKFRTVFESKLAPVWRGNTFNNSFLGICLIQMFKKDGEGRFQPNSIKPRIGYLNYRFGLSSDKTISLSIDNSEDNDNYIYGNGGGTPQSFNGRFWDVRFEKLRFNEYLLPNHNRALLQILDKVKIMEAEFMLDYTDFAHLRFDIPIYLNINQPGKAPIQGYFYVNEIKEFPVNFTGVSTVELVRIN